ncbi:MFS transporter [Sulfobacillus thermosulfidooxidans]|uniref:MFS transporter n=1 Tax=Sulfobacillus thermosulfidooxidans TaxID=28034 RepID=UPI0006B67200|nr:MFS transporter [Sulfobacillus thermosulfidooxidans]
MEKLLDDTQSFLGKVEPKWYLLWAMLSQTGMTFVQQGVIVLGFFLATKYALNFQQIGFITSAMSLGVMTSMVFMGILADTWGPKRLLFRATWVMALLALGLRWVQGFVLVLVCFFLLGMSLSAVPMSGSKAIFTAFQDRDRGMPMGIRQTGVPLGAALAAVILPVIVIHFGLSAVYLLFMAELVLFNGIFSAVIPNIKSSVRETPKHSSSFRPLKWPAIVSFLMVAGQYFLVTFTLEYLHDERHLTLGQSGWALAMAQIGGGLGRILFGRISDRLKGNRPRVISFTGILGSGMIAVILLLPAHVPYWLIVGVWFLTGMGTIGWNALSLTWAAESVASQQAGFAMGLVGTIIFLGSAIFPPLLGSLIDWTKHFAGAWATLMAILLLASAVAWHAGRQNGTHSQASNIS